MLVKFVNTMTDVCEFTLTDDADEANIIASCDCGKF